MLQIAIALKVSLASKMRKISSIKFTIFNTMAI